MKPKSLFEVPIPLEAKTKEELVRVMIANNLKKGMWCSYSFPEQTKKGWVCWFYWDTSIGVEIE